MGNKYCADFETTTDENDCRVWAWGVCEVGNPEYFTYGNNLDSFFSYMEKSKNSTFYFHNLKFDGEFLLVWLFEHGFKWVENRKHEDTKTFTTLISDKGQFYSIKIIFEKKGKKTNTVTIYDSLKILPFSVSQIAKGFNLPISKLEIDYKEKREVGHVLTQQEVDYLRNDVDIVARALHVLFTQGLDKMTQGSNALHDYKRMTGQKNFERWFPIPDYDYDVRQSYKGGFTYLNPKYKNLDIFDTLVLDVNSLYPWVMHDCPLPYGDGVYFEGQYKEDKLYNLYVQMFTCQFELKEGYIPTIQLKNNLSFIPTQYLTSSNDEEVTMCLTSVDLELFLEHYNVYNIEYHSGWKFKSTTGLFTDYIDKWTKVKIESGKNGNKAMRTLAKLMLNALYGKFALNPNVQSKIPYYDNGVIKYTLGAKETRNPIYIPVGTFITAWARHKTITSAQKVYDKFVYADTDSLHLSLTLPEEIKQMNEKELADLTTADLRRYGVDIPEDFEIDGYKLGAWKVEEISLRSRYIRQKSYLHDTNKPETWGGEGYDPKLLSITCAGMPEACYKFVTWENFHEGQSYSGKLQPKHVAGGIVLKDIDFTIKRI
ncbi:MAG: hypothetical protein IJX16_00260 [Clostridia bacterium]|nr:hypothetical protein [Clostridia bacterium]